MQQIGNFNVYLLRGISVCFHELGLETVVYGTIMGLLLEFATLRVTYIHTCMIFPVFLCSFTAMFATDIPPGQPGSKYGAWDQWVDANASRISKVVETAAGKDISETNWHSLAGCEGKPFVNKHLK